MTLQKASIENPLCPQAKYQRFLAVELTARSIDIKNLDQVGHQANMPVQVPVKTEREISLLTTNDTVVRQVDNTGPKRQLECPRTAFQGTLFSRKGR